MESLPPFATYTQGWLVVDKLEYQIPGLLYGCEDAEDDTKYEYTGTTKTWLSVVAR